LVAEDLERAGGAVEAELWVRIRLVALHGLDCALILPAHIGSTTNGANNKSKIKPPIIFLAALRSFL
jgi:hypothetical protein